jgi:8-hydroxy-5-deazaflavin:NADPH oxidoreductase
MRPVDTGPLRRARQLEHAGFLHMLVQEPLKGNGRTGLKFIS